MNLKPIVLGSTGMVGEGVLHECLQNENVDSVFVVNRRECGVKHPKLKEIILKDFNDFDSIQEELRNYNALYFCMGVSSIGKSEEVYTKLTYDLTLSIAKVFYSANPKSVITYVSGVGTDSSEKGKSMWARVKGKTENELLKLGFRKAYMYRPGYIQPIKGLKNTYRVYKFFTPFYPVLNRLFPNYVCTLEEIGNSMINVSLNEFDKNILECKEIGETWKI